VVDVLEGSMRQVLDEEFIPQVMANEQVEKWAHYARYERRFLGQNHVANLNCTFEMAREFPYYRLPLRSLSLAALVKHFFDQELDKTLQRADWGIRPLSHAHIEYAASDTEWCYRVYHNLRAIPRPPDPSEDDPALIRARYIELLIPLKKARLTCDYETAEDKVSTLDSERVELRDRMKSWLRFQGLEHWEDFRFSTRRERWKVEVRALQGVVLTNEPIQIPFPQRLRLAFADSDIETLIAAGRSKQSAVLRWLPRGFSVGLDAQLSRDWPEPEPD
jgi:hypothetical protein